MHPIQVIMLPCEDRGDRLRCPYLLVCAVRTKLPNGGKTKSARAVFTLATSCCIGGDVRLVFQIGMSFSSSKAISRAA